MFNCLKKGAKVSQAILKEIKAESFPNLMKYIKPLTQQIEQEKGGGGELYLPRCIILKLLKIKDRENLKSNLEVHTHTHIHTHARVHMHTHTHTHWIEDVGGSWKSPGFGIK